MAIYFPECLEYNGIQYPEGTVITINRKGYREDVTFYYAYNGVYYFKPYGYGTFFSYDKNNFTNIIVSITNNIDQNYINWKIDHDRMCRKPQYSFEAELRINALFMAWVWYIIIMIIAIFFKDCIGIWCLTSYIFLNYRKKKLKEAGYK